MKTIQQRLKQRASDHAKNCADLTREWRKTLVMLDAMTKGETDASSEWYEVDVTMAACELELHAKFSGQGQTGFEWSKGPEVIADDLREWRKRWLKFRRGSL